MAHFYYIAYDDYDPKLFDIPEGNTDAIAYIFKDDAHAAKATASKQASPTGYTLDALSKTGLAKTDTPRIGPCPSCFLFRPHAWAEIARLCQGMCNAIFVLQPLQLPFALSETSEDQISEDARMIVGWLKETIPDYKKELAKRQKEGGSSSSTFLILVPVGLPGHANLLCIRYVSGAFTWVLYEPHGSSGVHYKDTVDQLEAFVKAVGDDEVFGPLDVLTDSMQDSRYVNLHQVKLSSEPIKELEETLQKEGDIGGHCAAYCCIMAFMALYFDTINVGKLEEDILNMFKMVLDNYYSPGTDANYKKIFLTGIDNLARVFEINLIRSSQKTKVDHTIEDARAICCVKDGMPYNWLGLPKPTPSDKKPRRT